MTATTGGFLDTLAAAVKSGVDALLPVPNARAEPAGMDAWTPAPSIWNDLSGNRTTPQKAVIEQSAAGEPLPPGEPVVSSPASPQSFISSIRMFAGQLPPALLGSVDLSKYQVGDVADPSLAANIETGDVFASPSSAATGGRKLPFWVLAAVVLVVLVILSKRAK